MKIFLAGIIQGSLQEAKIHGQDWRDPIKTLLAEYFDDVEIYCHFSRHPNSISYELPEIRGTFQQGLEMACESDLVIAYLPSASMGTAIEIYEAFKRGSKIVAISPMVPNWVLRIYSHAIVENIEEFSDFVKSGKLQELVSSSNKKND